MFIGFAKFGSSKANFWIAPAIVNWPLLENKTSISNNGRYLLYVISNQPPGSQTLVIQGTKGSWKREFPGVNSGFFTGDDKQVVLQKVTIL